MSLTDQGRASRPLSPRTHARAHAHTHTHVVLKVVNMPFGVCPVNKLTDRNEEWIWAHTSGATASLTNKLVTATVEHKYT